MAADLIPVANPYGPVIDQLMIINHTRRSIHKTLPHNMLSMLPRTSLLSELYTVRVSAGRQTGKSNWIVGKAEAGMLIVTTDQGKRRTLLNQSFTAVSNGEVGYRLRESQIHDVNDVKALCWNKSEELSPYSMCVVDGYSLMSTRLSEKELFKWISLLVVEEPDILLLG